MPPRVRTIQPWTRDEVDQIVREQLIEAPDGRLSPLLRTINRAITATRDLGWARTGGKAADATRGHPIPMLASIAVLDALQDWCLLEAQNRVAELRAEAPDTTWSTIALATGYASGESARTHFSHERRAANAARQQILRDRARQTQQPSD